MENYVTTLQKTLDERFTDIDEVRDIVNHGISCGFNGFLYSSELCEFFDEHEDDIEDILDGLGIELNQLVDDPHRWTFQEMKEKSVWIVVENYCHQRIDEEDSED